MSFLPVVARELRVASRRSGTFWGRSAAALLAIAIGAWFFWTATRIGGTNTLGRELFQMVAFLIYIYAWLAGVTFSSDSVTAEKQEGTLGLLFLTSLQGHDLVIGKLTASSLGAFYRLLAVFPVMALTLLLGGVTGSEYWRMVAVLLNTLFASLAVGMFASTVSSNSRQAAILAFGILLAICIATPLFSWVMEFFLRIPVPDWVSKVTPFYGILGAQDAEYRAVGGKGTASTMTATASIPSNRVLFWATFCLTSVVGIISLMGAAYWLPRSWREGEQNGRIAGWMRSFWRTHQSQRMEPPAERSRLLEINPLLWLSARDEWKHMAVWLVLAVGGLIFLMLAWRNGPSWWDLGTYLITSLIAHFILKCWIAGEVPRRFLTDRGSGAMELYLCSRIGVIEILQGQFHALRRQFLGPITAVLAVDALFLLASDAYLDRDGNSWLLFWLARMFFLVLDFIALGWVGMWVAMTGRGRRTAWRVFFRVLFLPWLVSLFLLSLVLTVNWLGQWGAMMTDPMVFLGVWFLIGLITDVTWISYCRRGLTHGFRELAVHRVTSRSAGKVSVVS